MTADHQPTDVVWFKSSYSGGNATECLETAFIAAGVLIRDSKQPEGPWLKASPHVWNRFIAAQTA